MCPPPLSCFFTIATFAEDESSVVSDCGKLSTVCTLFASWPFALSDEELAGGSDGFSSVLLSFLACLHFPGDVSSPSPRGMCTSAAVTLERWEPGELLSSVPIDASSPTEVLGRRNPSSRPLLDPLPGSRNPLSITLPVTESSVAE